MKFRSGNYKYILDTDLVIQTPLIGFKASTTWINLKPDGTLTLYKGYAWDGASGPTIDTEDTHLPSAVHDALYILIRRGLLPKHLRKEADKLFYELTKSEIDRLSAKSDSNGFVKKTKRIFLRSRAYLWYKMVRVFGFFHT